MLEAKLALVQVKATQSQEASGCIRDGHGGFGRMQSLLLHFL